MNLRHPTILVVNKIELIKFQIKWIVHPNFLLTDKDLTILAYVYLYGGKAIEKMLDDKISSSQKSLENYISRFRKLTLIEGLRENTSLNPNIKISVRNLSYTIQFKLDVELDKKL